VARHGGAEQTGGWRVVMGFKEHTLAAYRFNLRYARALAAGVPAARAAESLGPGLENHPVWILGHLCTGAGLLAEDLGGENTVKPGWGDLFERRGPNDERLPDEAAAYPSLDEVLAELARLHGLVEEGLVRFPEERLAEREEWRLGADLPTIADSITFMAVTHEALHLGQFAAWRRGAGLPSAMATL
jgi:hypothetical protein